MMMTTTLWLGIEVKTLKNYEKQHEIYVYAKKTSK